MSASQPTLDDIWRLFQESDRKFREMSEETTRKFQESDRIFREMSQETTRKFQESERIFREMSQESTRKLQESERISREMSEEARREFREMSRETDRKIKAASESIGRLGNKLGDFVEYMVRPAAVRLFQERGIIVHEVHQHVASQRGDEGLEIDLLVVDDSDVIAIECKSSLIAEDVNEHLARLEKFKRLLPVYAEKQVMGAMAAMVLPDEVARYAYRHGLFVIAQNGDHLEVRNDAVFRPRVW